MNPEDGRLRARSSSPAAPVRKNNEIEISPSPNRRFLTAGAVASVLTVLASGTFLVLRSDPGTMIQVQIKGESLSVLNESGKKMWTVDFPGTDFGEFTRDRHFFIKDVDQDGRKELVFIQRPREREEESSRLICIDANGRELWDFEFGEELQVGKRRFSRTYEGIRVDWTETDGRAYVLAIGYHRPWYPSQTVLLEPSTGKVVGQYWHPGQLTDFALVDIDSDPEKEILLGGLNNPGPGLGRPILAALDFPFPSLGVEESFFGPQPGREITYLVFPEIDVHHARGLSPAVHGIHASSPW